MREKALHFKLGTGRPVPFEDIPEGLRSKKTLTLWLKANHGGIQDIPEKYVDDDLRRVSVRNIMRRNSAPDRAWESAQYILSQPDQAHLHHEILMVLMESGREYIKRIDQALVTREFLLQALERNGDCLIPYLDGNGGLAGLPFELDQEIIDAAVSNTTSLFSTFRPDQYSAEAVKSILRRSSYSDYGFLKRIGHDGLLTEMMRDEGHWPSAEPRPKYLWDAVEKMMACKGDRQEYHFFLRQFAVEDVIAEMKTTRQRQELLQMLTQDEVVHYLKITPALKTDRRFKARLIEDDLGM